MPRNDGHAPELEKVDVRFRNGQVVRDTEPSRWRWTLDDPDYPPAYAWDIASWQLVTARP